MRIQVTFVNPIHPAITVTRVVAVMNWPVSHMRMPNQARGTANAHIVDYLVAAAAHLTMLAVSMFRSYGVEERIAGNTRDKQRARSAAISAQQFAETFLSTTTGSLTPTACAGIVPSTGAIPVCRGPAPDFTTMAVPWTVGVT